MKMGLRGKILVPTLCAVFLTMGLASYFSYRKAADQLWNEMLNASSSSVDILAKGTGMWVEDIRAVLLIQSRSPQIVGFLREPSPASREAAVTALKELTGFEESVQAANLLDVKGETVLSSDPKATGNFADRDYFKLAMRGEASVSEPLVSRVTGKPVFIVAAPVKDGGRIMGVVYARVDLGKFTDTMVSPIRLGRTGHAFLATRQGLVFAHPDAALIMKRNLAESAWGRGLVGLDKGQVSHADQGEEQSVAFTREKATGWIVAVTVNRADSAEASKAVRDATAAFGGAGIVLVSLIIFFIVRAMVRDLAANADFAHAVAQGQLDRSLDVRRDDELGVLSDSLRVMVERLRGMIATAEGKTREAEEQTEIARKAVLQAEEALAQAERAKAEGMLAAAARLEDVVAVVSSASEELTAQVEESSRGSQEQARRTDETATAMEEMNATVLEVARNASQAAETTVRAKDMAEEGSHVVEKVVQGISHVMDQAQALKTDMNALGRRAEGISQVMTVINDIADQTNLLALNAAIEAARAGDAGRGFAVVADEVRKLAEKTMTATREVGEAISGIQQGARVNVNNVETAARLIEEATGLANSSGESLRQIVELVENAADQVRSIATAAEQQSAASEEINRSVEDINRISSLTSEAMRHASSAVAELSSQAQVLGSLIRELQCEGEKATDCKPLAATRALPS
ncbi:Methyl-accepting chemotaxis protein PctC [Fundidesulfovibrio magnetotacticus]|uniref:Methyl-accepting chemotaxis protein PctC n=1 Tax=Fundidesulfovibrio magnetotacticus TaxID=2730080 RepID=A0A6V8LWY0_9BACT|nr:methyl-accepting chemotaxis protein [Fundidesulfovibrio magnetotacticus]GFK92785.1 Methyl-accepting chemotaxis protein PctC [Fundidesulfovibrio magnetotacticus]